MLVLVATAPAYAGQKPAPSQDPLARMNEAMDALTKKVWPSVVQILVSSYGSTREDSGSSDANVVIGRQSSTGSGFVIDADGYIITNAHVVNGARRVLVVMPSENADGTLATALSGKTYEFPARIVGITTELDLALLKVDGQKLPALPLATYSQVRQGENVFAFGSPIGLRNSLTHGLISAVARQIDPDSPLIYVQTDAPINPGNSGGPLVNIRGEVVGVNTFIFSQSGGNEGLGFAIPSATVRTVYRQLRQYGQLRRQVVGIIEPLYYASGVSVLANKKAGLKTWEQLKGQKVCGIQGAWYNKPVAEKYGADIVAFKGQTEAEVALQQGNCVGWVYDDTAFAERLADPKWAGFEMTLPSIMEEPWGLAVPLPERDGAWGKFMSDLLVEWHKTGKLIELEKKWNIPASAFLKKMHEQYSKKGS